MANVTKEELHILHCSQSIVRDKIKNDDMGQTCSTLVGSKIYINTLVGKLQRVGVLERIRDILDK
jgi:hypothetical protein